MKTLNKSCLINIQGRNVYYAIHDCMQVMIFSIMINIKKYENKENKTFQQTKSENRINSNQKKESIRIRRKENI